MKIERILLTGSTGFIGSALLPRLLETGYEVHTLERYVTGRYKLMNEGDVIKHYASLTDYARISQIVKEVQPHALIHLASISAVSFSYDNYMEVSDTNYTGSINLFEACRKEAYNFQQAIVAGTSEEYGMALTDTNSSLEESSPLEPNSPYAVAKVAMDYYLRYMAKAYNFPYTLLRPFNTYGRTDNKHFFIERVITQMLADPGGVVALGDPEAVRDWLYVDDHVAGYLAALGNPKALGEAFNICSGEAYTTKETAGLIAELAGFRGRVLWKTTTPRPLDAKVLKGSNAKAKRLLDWAPKVPLREGLAKTIEAWKQKLGGFG